jgi:hypothetical protein
MNAMVEHIPAGQVINMTPLQSVRIQMTECQDLARLEKLMELEKRWHAEQAERAYVTAFALFKKNMPDVVKDMLNKQYGSDYSSLANLVNTTNKVLGEYDLNARWDPDQSGGTIKITCIMTHAEGHSERVSLFGPPDTTGQKNPLQQIKSTLTYLEGATFQAITGVVARSASTDDDANSSGEKRPEAPAAPVLPAAPEGYMDWADNLAAVVDEGRAKLLETWKNAAMPYRTYMAKHEAARWARMKKDSERVPS